MSLLKLLKQGTGLVSAGHGERVFFIANATALEQTMNFSVFQAQQS